jgi:hypothetical protein
MAVCKLMEGCLFFNDKMADMPATAEMLKDQFCRGDNSKCARHMVYNKLGTPRIPPDLYPYQVKQAQVLITVG